MLKTRALFSSRDAADDSDTERPRALNGLLSDYHYIENVHSVLPRDRLNYPSISSRRDIEGE